MSTEACPACLRRTWLVGMLAPYIANLAAQLPGRRSPELLALPDGELIAAVGGGQRTALHERAASIEPAGCLRALRQAGLWACCRHAELFPQGLTEAPDPPAALIGRGDPALLAEIRLERTIAVVGARRATAYGLGVARDLARQLSAAGMVVVSGMANGIDASSHAGALEGGGLTVAVLGGGPDRAYPAGQSALYRRIQASGLVISELPPGSRPYRWSFPARNRIMAGLARMTVVVEAAEQSGSLITAAFAADLGREVGAVPGPVTAALSRGANRLLRDGAAVIRDARDILDAALGPGAVAPGPPLDAGSAALLELIEAGIQTPDVLAATAGAGPAEVAVGLARLELLDYVRRKPSGGYARTLLRPPARAGSL